MRIRYCDICSFNCVVGVVLCAFEAHAIAAAASAAAATYMYTQFISSVPKEAIFHVQKVALGYRRALELNGL